MMTYCCLSGLWTCLESLDSQIIFLFAKEVQVTNHFTYFFNSLKQIDTFQVIEAKT